MNNKDNRVLLYGDLIGLIVTPWNCDVIETSIFGFLTNIFLKERAIFMGHLSVDNYPRLKQFIA